MTNKVVLTDGIAFKVGLPRHSDILMRRLWSMGAPGNLQRVRPFLSSDHIGIFTSQIPQDMMRGRGRTRKRTWTAQQQHVGFHKAIDTAFNNPYVMCVSELNNDMRAKLLVAYLIAKLLTQLPNASPRWHTVLGGFRDPLRDAEAPRSDIDLLVLSNVPVNSSNTKLEKVRDLLEMYSDIPRIVVTTGVDPYTLFATQLYHALNYPIHYPIIPLPFQANVRRLPCQVQQMLHKMRYVA